MHRLHAGLSRSRAVLALAALLVAAVGAADASASTIYYRCGGNICTIAPDGTGQRQLTTGGGYVTPSISRDGTKLAFVHGNSTFVADANAQNAVDVQVNTALLSVIRPDGAKVAVINEQQEAFGSLVPYLVDVNSDGTGYANESRYAQTTGYVGTTLLRNGDSSTSHMCRAGYTGNCPAMSICAVAPSGSCGASVADDPVRDLRDPAGSPDGTLVAVTAVPYPNNGTDYNGSPHQSTVTGSIALYNASTGAFVRDLTSSTTDSQPAFSPDGTQVAFSRGGSVYVTSATGAPGSEHLLVQGDSPSWGAAGGSTAGSGGGGSQGGGGNQGGGGDTPGGSPTAAPHASAYSAHCVHRHGRRVCTQPRPLHAHTYRGKTAQGNSITVKVDKKGRYVAFATKGLTLSCPDGTGAAEDVAITPQDRQRVSSKGVFSTEIDYTPGDGFSQEIVYVVGAFDGGKARGTIVGNAQIAGHGECTTGRVAWSAKG